jgi:hypothetical protein
VPSAAIAKYFGDIVYFRAFLIVYVSIKADLTFPTFKRVGFVLVLGIFYIKAFTATGRAFGFRHKSAVDPVV